MVDFLLSIVGLAALGGAIYEFYEFVYATTRRLPAHMDRLVSRWCWR